MGCGGPLACVEDSVIAEETMSNLRINPLSSKTDISSTEEVYSDAVENITPETVSTVEVESQSRSEHDQADKKEDSLSEAPVKKVVQEQQKTLINKMKIQTRQTGHHGSRSLTEL